MRKIYIAILATLAITALACGSGTNLDDNPGQKTIVLEVTGAKTADITYGLDADQSQEQDAEIPWKKTITSTDPVVVVTLLASNKGTGTIGCKISMDGEIVKENKSSGQYATVACTANSL